MFKNLLGLLWISFYLYWLISAARSKKNLRTPNWNRNFLIRLALVVIAIAIFRSGRMHDEAFWRIPTNIMLTTAGFLAAVVGLFFAVWARVHIGRNWGIPMAVKVDPEIVTSGPYGLVRHPIYSGIILALLGSSAVFGPWVLLSCGFFTVYAVYSAFTEEKIMTSQFPEAYPRYKQNTKMLVPYLL